MAAASKWLEGAAPRCGSRPLAGLAVGPPGGRGPKKSALSASADGGIAARFVSRSERRHRRPRCEVVDLALPSVEDQNLDGALAAEPRHHRLRADLACPTRHEGPGNPRPVRYVRLPVLPAAQRRARRAGRGGLRPARRQAPAPPPRPAPAGPLRPPVRRVRIAV